MLRLETQSETTREITYALSGQLTQEHLPELKELLTAARAAGRRVVLDLAGIVLVDRELVRWLASSTCLEVELVHCPAYVLSWIRCEGGDEERKTQ
jgi:ABC-type transporter Mla MlaB component